MKKVLFALLMIQRRSVALVKKDLIDVDDGYWRRIMLVTFLSQKSNHHNQHSFC